MGENRCGTGKEEWGTPPILFEYLNQVYGPFTLDPCATKQNAKCDRFFTKADNGLLLPWAGHTVFMNPPYGKPEHKCKPVCKKKTCVKRGYHLTEYKPGLVDWLEKAYLESLGQCRIVCVIPSATGPGWWHEYVDNNVAKKIIFLRGRLKFVGANGSAPFDSAVAVLEEHIMKTVYSTLDVRGWS